MPDDRAPDVAGEIVGWKAWAIEDFHGDEEVFREPRLVSPAYGDMIWAGDAWTYAECERCPEIPGENCRCGIWAAKDRPHLIRQGYQIRYRDGSYDDYVSDEMRVIGEVGLAGGVIPAERGWRAQKARVRRLYVPHDLWELVLPLRRIYRVPVELDNIMKPT